MLSYQHGYHAGNFADVMKHAILMRLLTYLVQKDKPLFYLETHAGKGLYDLHSKQSLKTGEAQQGIESLWLKRAALPSVFSPYIQAIQAINEPKVLRHYPGSPSLALNVLRSQDRIYCCELHPAEYQVLKQLRSRDKKIFFSQSDGMAQMNAMLPPPERRGLVFIDPSYEVKTEYREIPRQIKAAYARFETGVYCLWYPFVDKTHYEQLIRGLKQIGAPKVLRAELKLNPSSRAGMSGCGLWIINPPYRLVEEVREILTHLCQCFNPGVSSFLLEEC